MRIQDLSIYKVNLPLKKRVDHASATRKSSENVVVRCKLAGGCEGWGEGVPREYVTGESPDGAIDQLAETPLAEQLDRDCSSWSDVVQLCDRFQPAKMKDDPRGCYGNALRCAVELSILDAYGRLFGEPVSKILDSVPEAATVRASHSRVRYSGAVATAKPLKARISALMMRAYGFAQCKVKVGMAGDDDTARVKRIRRWLGPRMDIRLDANEAWSRSEVVQKIEPLVKYNITCIEQPVPHEEVDVLAEVRKRVQVPLMLDESFTGVYDAQQAIQRGTCDVLNIRLSKCGGFVHCLRLAVLAKRAGLGYQLGCHPGESGILSAAGRHWAASVANIRYVEGSYDRHLVHEPLTQEDLTFGYGGWAPALAGPGLGVHVDRAAVERIATRSQHFAI